MADDYTLDGLIASQQRAVLVWKRMKEEASESSLPSIRRSLKYHIALLSALQRLKALEEKPTKPTQRSLPVEEL